MLLTELSVVQLTTGVAAAYCGQLLADLGAEVVAPRRVASRLDIELPYVKALEETLGRNTKRMEYGDLLTKVSQGVDVVIAEGNRDDVKATITATRASQIVVAITGFGLTGPRSSWVASELVSCAYGGGCQQNGEPGRQPLGPPPFVAALETGVTAAVGALVAYQAKQRDGLGQIVDVSSALAWATIQTAVGLLEYVFQGRIAQRAGRQFHGRAYPYTILPAAEGEVRLICLTGHEWRRAIKMMGSPKWASDPRYADRQANALEFHDELDDLIGGWLADLRPDDILRLASEHKVPWAPLRTVDELLTEPQLSERGFFWSKNSLTIPGSPSKFSRTPTSLWSPDTSPSPEDGTPRDPIGVSRPDSEKPAPALAGIRILDLGWSWAGGTVGSFLADFGADVIKVESRNRLDPMRQDRPLVGRGDPTEQGGLHHNVNRNKRSLEADLTTEEGQRKVQQLATKCDVVIENFSPGVADRLGVGYQDLSAINEGLVYLSLGAVGGTGPLSGIRAYAPVITALSGLDSLVGYPNERPMGLQHGLADPNAGLHGAVAVLAALIEKQRSGRGQHIDFSQLEAMVALLAPHIVAYQLTGERPATSANRHPLYAPQGVYRCEGEDHWIALTCVDDEMWAALCTAISAPPEAGHSEFRTLDGRAAAHSQIDEWITSWTSERDRWEAAEALQAFGVVAAPLLDTADRFADRHLQEQDAFVPVDHPVVGGELVYGVPWKLSRTPGQVRRPAPLLGQHTSEIVEELSLAFSGAKLRQHVERR